MESPLYIELKEISYSSGVSSVWPGRLYYFYSSSSSSFLGFYFTTLATTTFSCFLGDSFFALAFLITFLMIGVATLPGFPTYFLTAFLTSISASSSELEGVVTINILLTFQKILDLRTPNLQVQVSSSWLLLLQELLS